MLKITPNSEWEDMMSTYGEDVKLRYEWFLFEFGKRASKLFYKNLMEQIGDIQGTSEYKQALMLAEIRDRSHKSWWAIVASAKTIGDAKYDPKTSIFQVISRFKNVAQDPVEKILEDLGPWTIDTLPFVPSPRAGQVVLKTETESRVKEILDRNMRQGQKTRSAMVFHGIAFEPRHTVYKKLKVIEDVELLALRIEFGLVNKSKPHWRPSLRWLKRQGIEKLGKDRDLLKVWLNPDFMKYRVFHHSDIKLTPVEVKRIEDFQRKVRV